MKNQNKSLTKGLQIFKEILYSPKALTAVVLCKKFNIDKSTMSRILNSLISEGFIKYLDNSKAFEKADLLDVMSSKESRNILIDNSKDLLEKIFNLTNECTYLAVEDNKTLIYLNQIDNSTRVIKMRDSIGLFAPLHCTALGKVILAFAEVNTDILELEEYTSNTLVKKRYIDKTIEIVKVNSYAIEIEEFEYGLSSVSVAIYNKDKRFLAAVGISGLSARLDKTKLEFFAKEMLKLSSQSIRL